MIYNLIEEMGMYEYGNEESKRECREENKTTHV